MLNPVEEKVGDSLEYTDTGKHFLNRPLIAQALRSTINKQREPQETEKLLRIKEHYHSDKAAAADGKDF